jgi:DNA (cytosine-5)-methyltransferase 1
MMLRLLDLFSGIGGFSLGLERSGTFKTVAFCEIDPFCRRVLACHWPEVPCYSEVRNLPVIEADALCGGPPCQKTSVAAAIHGNRTGETLWPAMRDVAARGGFQWIIVEQPAGNVMWERQVARDLADLGFHHARLERSARNRGAPHSRRRVFFVANPVRQRCEAVARFAKASTADPLAWPAPPRGAWQSSGAGNRRMDDGLSGWVDRLRALGNAVVPQIPEMIGRAIAEAMS